MTREEARKAAEVMLAYADGKDIEFCFPECGKWYIAENPSFDWSRHNYHIKQEPTYRPFKDKDECWAEMQKHQPFGWIKSKDSGNFSLIGFVQWYSYFEDVMVTFAATEQIARSASGLFKKYTFADGAPFGIKE